MLTESLGYIAGILIVSSMIPQIVKNWKERSAKDISMARSIVYVIGVLSFVIYGILINNGPILLMNIFGLCLGLAGLSLKIAYG
ncbi:MAG: SemiSWEET family transporter [Candidatus Woesearchaeota archaeon]